MYSDPAQLFADHLTLSRVNARANVNAELPDRVHNCPAAADRTRRTVKRRHETVTGSVDFASPMLCEVLADKGVMLRQKVLPSPVTEFDKPLRRIDNVGK
jgi:hypothetical protein